MLLRRTQWRRPVRKFDLYAPLPVEILANCLAVSGLCVLAARVGSLTDWLTKELARKEEWRPEEVEERGDQDRPCLHCMMVELIDEFFEEYPAEGEAGTIDTNEVITAIAKAVAELTCNQDGTIRQQIIEQLMREIMEYDAEFRREDAAGATGSVARH